MSKMYNNLYKCLSFNAMLLLQYFVVKNYVRIPPWRGRAGTLLIPGWFCVQKTLKNKESRVWM